MTRGASISPYFWDILYAIDDHQPVTLPKVAQLTGLRVTQVRNIVNYHRYMFRQERFGHWRVVRPQEMDWDDDHVSE